MSFWKDKRVLVTGHTGFKGSWLAFWLNHLGANLCGFALEPETEPCLFDNLDLESKIRSHIGDIKNATSFQNVVQDFRPEIVFHLAAQSLVRRSYREPVETYATNVMGTVNLLEVMRKTDSVKSIVIITTDKVYENKERDAGYAEGDRLGGFDPYSNSKACAELVVSSYRNSFFSEGKTLVATARAGNVIGGGDWSEGRLVPDVFRSLIFGEELLIRNPNSVRPWQHVLEPLSGYMVLAQGLFEGRSEFATAWNFGPEDEDSKPVGFILNEIESIWTEDVKWEIQSGDHPHETNLLKLDSTKAKTDLKWSPRLNLSEALRLTINWYQSVKSGVDLEVITRDQLEFYSSK